MDPWQLAEDTRALAWHRSLLASLASTGLPASPTALALLRFSARRLGGTSPSLIEHEGLLARALACTRASLIEGVVVETVAPNAFALIFESADSSQAIGTRCSELQSVLEKHLALDSAFDVRVECGHARSPEHACDAEALFEAADAALSICSPEQPTVAYSAKAQARAAARAELAVELRHAFHREELELHYQPQVDPGTGRVLAVEALVRWRRSDGTLLSPGDFFGLASSDDFFLELGEWSLRESLRQLGRWREAGCEVHRVAVNIAPEQLRHHDLVAMTTTALRRAGESPSSLELELTESQIVENLDRCAEAFAELRERGIRIAIDDFGTGYSSLEYLKRLPADVLKLDRAFVTDLIDDPTSRTVARAAVEIARGLQLSSIAEGIETERQFLQAAALGFNRLQGYWIARPAPPASFPAWLAKRADSRLRARRA